ncbi:hypothetical protein KFK09_004774 [Dendrobium nobile]|uniref:Poor homologous synapsis 1 PH domain-containing protein n=1 Tax=Dendrobium nobile TaxID=94219 RepID=A0A8T3BZ52_DENNO|nr:hypothetical protein KFK09_004774 [Dendrobium nobile]
MTEAAATPSTLTPSALPAPNPPTMREQWEGEFSRFFIFQWQHSPTVDVAPRPLTTGRGRYCRGTWLTASLPATILIVKASSSDVAVLSISVAGYIHEEHIVSTLHLTWPQVACVPQCPVRGSRVVFMSYRDCSNQIQKFVVRFLTCADAETFIYFFKDCSRDTMDFAYPASDLLCDSSSPSKMIASYALEYISNEGECYEEAITNDMPSPAFGQDESYRPLPLVNSSNTITSFVPPSFTELLSNCSKYPQNEISKQLEEANHTLRSGESAPPFSPQSDSKQLVVLDADMKNEIARYMSDASFHDLLFTIEKVFHELGESPSL